jgi:hypothetical protein
VEAVSAPAATALAWLAALGRREAPRLLSLSDPGIVIFGPRGATKGYAALGMWFGETRVALTPRDVLQCGDRILVRHQTDWLDREGRRTHSAANASVIAVRDGKVKSFLWDDGPDPELRQGFGTARAVMLEGIPQ